MMGKTKTVSPLRKFYRWKYSGLIVVPLEEEKVYRRLMSSTDTAGPKEEMGKKIV